MVLAPLRRRAAQALLVVRTHPRTVARNVVLSSGTWLVAGVLVSRIVDGLSLAVTLPAGFALAALRYLWRAGAPTGVLTPQRRDLLPSRYEVPGIVVLRQVRRGDAAAIRDTLDDVVVRTMGWRPSDVAAVEELAEHPIAARAAGVLVVCEPGDDGIAGIAMLTTVDEGRAVQLGLWLGAAHRGHGLGARAIRGCLDVAWHLRFDEVVLGTSATNHAMRRAAERNGAELHREVDHELPDGQVQPSCWYRWTRPARR